MVSQLIPAGGGGGGGGETKVVIYRRSTLARGRCGDAYRPLCKSVPTLIFVSINQPPRAASGREPLIIINAARINRGGTPSRDPPPDPKGFAAIIAVSSIIAEPIAAITASLARAETPAGRVEGERGVGGISPRDSC
jgi:hypothetical protein